MRRRRQKNPLLMRIIGISILVHIIALPLLAQFGAFKKIQEHFVQVTTVKLPPPPEPEKAKPEAKKTAKQPQKPTRTARKAATTTAHQRQAAQRTNLNQPKVIASGPATGEGGDNGPTVDPNGTGKAGELPTKLADKTPPTVKAEPTPEPKPQPKPEAPAPIAKAMEKQVEPKPEPKPSPAPVHEPVFTEVAPTYSPQPTLPDDLRAEALDKTFVAEVVVSSEGVPTDVHVAQSTGNDELDKLALETARKWKFKPATKDGQPIESRVRLHIEFQVS